MLKPPPKPPRGALALEPTSGDLRNGAPLVVVEAAHPNTPSGGPGSDVRRFRVLDDGLQTRDPAWWRGVLDDDPTFGQRLGEGVQVGFRLVSLPRGDTSRRHLPPMERWVDVPCFGKPPALVARPPDTVRIHIQGVGTFRVPRSQGTDADPVYSVADGVVWAIRNPGR